MMKRQIVREEIYSKSFNGDSYDIKFSDLPKDIQDNDIIGIVRDEGYYSENNSYDAYTELVIIRERNENDDEYNKRLVETNKFLEESKKNRYESYLRLKKEFENNDKIQILVDEENLYFVNVPTEFTNFIVVNYGYAGRYLMETDSKELNHWKILLPHNYSYEVLGFVNDVIVGEIPTDKNFVLRKVKI
jgi:hypothetical protein